MKRFFTLLAATALTVAAAAAPDVTAERNPIRNTGPDTAQDTSPDTVQGTEPDAVRSTERNAACPAAAKDCPSAADKAKNTEPGTAAACPAAAPAQGLSYRERSEMIMTADRVRKTAVSAVHTREARRTARKAFNAVWRELADRHEITAGYCMFPYSWSNEYAGLGSNTGISFEYAGNKYSYSPRRSIGGFTVGYMYRLSRRWSAGMSASMSVVSTTASVNDRKMFINRTTTLGIIPTVRFSWIDRPLVKCYSELQISCTFDLLRNSADRTERWNHSYALVAPMLAGVSVGRRLYGFAELGTGLRGVVCAGIGYRFR